MELTSCTHLTSTQLHKLVIKHIIFPCVLFIIYCTLLCIVLFIHGTEQGSLYKIMHNNLLKQFEGDWKLILTVLILTIRFSYYGLTLELNPTLSVAPLW